MGGRRLGALTVALLLLVGLLAYLARDPDEAASRPAPAAAPAPPSPSTPPRPAPGHRSLSPSATWQVAEGERERRQVVRKIGDSIDPCQAVFQPAVPDGFETLTAEGVTIAWPAGVKIEPTTLAFLSAGLLAQLGIVTGTQPREDLVVIVYPSVEEFRAKAGAPAWSDGAYDGAVRIPTAHTELGVELHTLRHELAHAQIHAAIGCTPIWLDEGLAQYFANTTPWPDWLQMLEHKRSLGLARMAAANVDDIPGEPSAVYAQSLAMVLYVVARGDRIADLLHDDRGAKMDLWSRRYPDATEAGVLDAVARQMFGMPTGADLDAVLAGPVCCHSFTSLSELGCHGPPRQNHETCYSSR